MPPMRWPPAPTNSVTRSVISATAPPCKSSVTTGSDESRENRPKAATSSTTTPAATSGTAQGLRPPPEGARVPMARAGAGAVTECPSALAGLARLGGLAGLGGLAALGGLAGFPALTPVQLRHFTPTPVCTMQSAHSGFPHVLHVATRGRRRWFAQVVGASVAMSAMPSSRRRRWAQS